MTRTTHRRTQVITPNEMRIVLFDLDHTLMDSTLARRSAWKRALHEFRHIIPVERSMHAFDAIYQCSPQIRGLVGPHGHRFEDMRQEWNTRISYSLLLAWKEQSDNTLWSRDSCMEELQGIFPVFDARQETPPSLTQSALRLLERAEDICDRRSIDYLAEIDEACGKFWKGSFRQYLFPGVKQLLQRLHSNGIRYFIATEGHYPSQWRKLRVLGLTTTQDAPQNDWRIRPGQLLATSQAAAPFRGNIDSIGQLAQWYKGHATATATAVTALDAKPCNKKHHEHETGCPVAHDLEIDSASANLVARGLERLIRPFSRLYTKTPRPGVVTVDFYSRVLYAISQDAVRPGDTLTGVDFQWAPSSPFRVAMVGDRKEADVYPVLELSGELRGISKQEAIMSIWVRGQGPHNRPKRANVPQPLLPPQHDTYESRAIKLAHIEDVTDVLIGKNNLWERVIPFTRDTPQPPLFINSLEPAEPMCWQDVLSLDGKKEAWEDNVKCLVAAVAAVGVYDSFEERDAETDRSKLRPPERRHTSLLLNASAAVRSLLRVIIPDICLGDKRGRTINLLCSYLPSYPDYHHGNVPLLKCPGIARAIVHLILDLARGTTCRLVDGPLLDSCLGSIAGMLSDKAPDWVNAIVDILTGDSDGSILNHIRSSDSLYGIYFSKLSALMASNAPHIQYDTIDTVLRRLRRNPVNGSAVSGGATAHLPEPAGAVGKAFYLGRVSIENAAGQGWVGIGVDTDHNMEARMLLAGEKARNIAVVCGKPGGGKSRALRAFISGAMQLSEGAYNRRSSPSTVVVFHHRSALTDWEGMLEKPQMRERSSLLTDRSFIESARTEPSDSAWISLMRPLAFALSELSTELLCEWAGVGGTAIAERLAGTIAETKRRTRKDNKLYDFPALCEGIRRSEEMPKVKRKILNSLEQRLRPLLITPSDESALSFCAPGRMVFVDYGRLGNMPLDDRKLAWLTVLSVLFNPNKRIESDENYLLVFDELHEAFPHSPQTRVEKQLLEKLGTLNNLGRHFQVSVLLASQSPEHFVAINKFAGSAGALFVFELEDEGKSCPGGRIWNEFRQHKGTGLFTELGFGRAWYCGFEGKESQIRTGQIDAG